MALNLTITQVQDEDYDGNPLTLKRVIPDIDGTPVDRLVYSFESTVSDADIRTAVEADLTAKGYTW